MAKFRKKPVVIEAEQFIITNWKQIENWTGGKAKAIGNWRHENDVISLAIDTLEGTMSAIPNDWIIKGIQGEFYPCKPDIFEATYEPV